MAGPQGPAQPIAPWPDAVDLAALGLFALAAFGVPALGYVFMVIDIRRYLRSLRRAIAVVAAAASRRTPSWALQQQPPCLESLELSLPCTEEEVLAAYRARVKSLHPDRGGNLQQFLRLQKHFEQALHLARMQAKGAAPAPE